MSGTQIMVVLIVAIVAFASIIKAKLGLSPQRRPEPVTVDSRAENARLRDEVVELKKRLAVLERITVEKENSLERQIEALRDR